MSEHFLTDINIVQYKCFNNFQVKDLKRVNLISGKNNAGKTAFMEGCYINCFSNDNISLAFSIMHIKYKREKINFLSGLPKKNDLVSYLEVTKFYSSKSNIRKIDFSVNSEHGIKEYIFVCNEDIVVVNAKNFNLETFINKNVKNIDNFGWKDEDLILAYEDIQKSDKEEELDNLIQEFDSNIETFKVIGRKPQCKINGKYVDIVEFGDGLKHFITIIAALYSCKDGYLFIDEIDNGIHYTQLDRLWEIILTISKEVNCQVFATTHSKEMIESYARVAKKLEDKDIAFIEMGKKEDELKALIMDYKKFTSEIDSNNEVRGW